MRDDAFITNIDIVNLYPFKRKHWVMLIENF